MLTGIIIGNTVKEVLAQIERVTDDVDVFEWRLDYLSELSIDIVKNVCLSLSKPVIFTLRALQQNGLFQGSEVERLNYLKHLAELNPDYIDLEGTVPDAFIDQLHREFPTIRIIRSYHHFELTPDDLPSILKSLEHPCCQIYKIVTQAKNSLDSLRMLDFVRQHSGKTKLIGHCMGDFGRFSRVLGAACGNYLTYASIGEEEAAAGLLSVRELLDHYYLQHLNRETRFTALIGDPVSQSIGHQFHNKVFAVQSYNAVYVMITLRRDELSEFFSMMKALPFVGFSVTMPLKESVLDVVDEPDDSVLAIGATNTLGIDHGNVLATNTDAGGAIKAIAVQYEVQNKKLLLLGAGGAAKALVYSLQQAGAEVTVLNRSLERAQLMTDRFGARALSFDQLEQCQDDSFDGVINCIDKTVRVNESVMQFLSKVLVDKPFIMDISAYFERPGEFNRYLLEIFPDAEFVYGQSMFIEQGLLQQEFWQKSLS